MRCDNIPDNYCIPTQSCSQSFYLALEVHDKLAELEEMFSLQRLGEVIRNHVFSGTVIAFYFTLIDVFGDKKT